MNDQLKPGDLCLIVGALHFADNIGKTCELVQMLQPVERFTGPDWSNLIYPPDFEPAWIIQGDGIFGRREFNRGRSNSRVTKTKGWGICYPRFLMPLRGDFEPMQQVQRDEQPA